MRQPRHYYNETFKVDFYFFFGWTESLVNKWLKSEHPTRKPFKFKGANGYTVYHQDDRGDCIFIWIEDKENIPVMAHEFLHAVNFALDNRGVKADFENDEIQAYFIQILFEKALK